mmetsp:Transcript_7680/g.8682  ORF Transcript_7680/g.8682 Transcript_7680/m.8682 type:complete len:216 (-) Transcript_7680:84-731(-)
MDLLPDPTLEGKIPSFEEIIIDIFEQAGIEAYDTKTIQQILKFMQKYAKDIYNKADLIRLHANKKRDHVNVDDIKLAIEAHNENSFYKSLNRETIEKIAMRRNANSIPQSKFYSNLIDQIPESDYTLTQPNFEVFDEEIQDKLKDQFLNQNRGGKDDEYKNSPSNKRSTGSKRRRDRDQSDQLSSSEKPSKHQKRQDKNNDVDFFANRDSYPDYS